MSTRLGASSARWHTRRRRLGSSPWRLMQHKASLSRSGLCTRAKLPPVRQRKAAAVQTSSRVQLTSPLAAALPSSGETAPLPRGK